MKRTRVIPTLLIQDGGLVKGEKFRNHKYVGDPINAVKIFNDKEVDELAIIDISATKQKKSPNILQINEIASEAFMPVSYGGGINSLEQVDKILFHGIEKVILNTSALNKPSLVTEIARKYGNQSVIVSIDVKKDWLGRYYVYSHNGKKNTKKSPVQFAKECENLGAGEIMLTSIDNEGTYSGYDLQLIKSVSDTISIPVIANGGAGSLEHFKEAISNGASAVAAGNLFVFQRPYNAVLISYIDVKEIELLNKSPE